MVDMRDDRDLIELSERQHALVARRQVRALGYSQSATTRMWSRSPLWDPITDQVARRVGAPRTTPQALMAAVLDAGGDAILSHLCGNGWWGHRGCSLRPVTLSTTVSSRRRTSLARTHKVDRIEPHWTTVLDGVPIARPELLALQMFDVCRYERAERYTEWLWSQRLLSGASIHRFLAEMGERGRNGTAGLRRYLKPRGVDYVPPASGLESRAMQIFEAASLWMRRQIDSGGERWTGRVDFRHERHPLIVEIQSERYHTALVDRVADRRRRQRLEADGFVVVELTDVDVWARPAVVVSRTSTELARYLARINR